MLLYSLRLSVNAVLGDQATSKMLILAACCKSCNDQNFVLLLGEGEGVANCGVNVDILLTAGGTQQLLQQLPCLLLLCQATAQQHFRSWSLKQR